MFTDQTAIAPEHFPAKFIYLLHGRQLFDLMYIAAGKTVNMNRMDTGRFHLPAQHSIHGNQLIAAVSHLTVKSGVQFLVKEDFRPLNDQRLTPNPVALYQLYSSPVYISNINLSTISPVS